MKRVLTAAALIPPVVYVVLWSPRLVVFLVVATVALVCYHEYAAIANRMQAGSAGPLGYAAGLAALAWPGDLWLGLTVLALIAMALAMRSADLAQALPRASYALLGVVYIFGCWRCALEVRGAGGHWLMFALLVNWTGDAGAYYAGRALGRHKLAPQVSPKKTWEGSAGSVAAALLLAAPYLYWFAPGTPALHAAGLTVAANVAGQIGDLAESAIKRGAGVKDSGALLPGHGGLLDRVDSTLFALPVVLGYLRSGLYP
jgi:phosphatidate cytidylyltransferase